MAADLLGDGEDRCCLLAYEDLLADCLAVLSYLEASSAYDECRSLEGFDDVISLAVDGLVVTFIALLFSCKGYEDLPGGIKHENSFCFFERKYPRAKSMEFSWQQKRRQQSAFRFSTLWVSQTSALKNKVSTVR